MSCRIPYDRLQILFDKSLQYDREKYRFYKNSIYSIIDMQTTDEAKVHAIWFMALAYNNALEIENDIVTEGLPAKISDLVFDSLTDPNASYSELINAIKSLLSSSETTAQPVSTDIKTTVEKVNEVLVSLKKANTNKLSDSLKKLQKIIETDNTLTNAQKIDLYDKFIEGLNSKPESGIKATLLAIIDSEKSDLNPSALSSSFIDVSKIEGIGDVFIIRKSDGTLLEAIFKNNGYFLLNDSYDGTNPEVLDAYEPAPLDHISPVYKTANSLSVSDNSGKSLRISEDLGNSGVEFGGVRVYETEVAKDQKLDNRKGSQKISDNLKTGTRLSAQVKLIADRRRVLLNKMRVDRLRAMGYPVTLENTLRANQINFLLSNPDKPAVCILQAKNGVEFTITDLDGVNWDSVVGLDNLGFVYADGTTRFVDWHNENDLNLLKETIKIFKWKPYNQQSKRQEYEWVNPNASDINRLKAAVESIKTLKGQVLDLMESYDDTFEVPPALFSLYFDISNVFKRFDFEPKSDDNIAYPAKQTLQSFKSQLLPTSSVVTTRIAQVSSGKVVSSSIKTEDVVGIVKRTDRGIEFEPSLEKGYQPIDENNNPITYEQLFKNAGVDIATLVRRVNHPNMVKYGFYYLVRKKDSWDIRAMQKQAPMTDFTEIVDFLSALSATRDLRPAFSPENTNELVKLVNNFNNRGWGFNVHDGIAANIDFLRMWNNEPVFGISFRALDQHPHQEEFNKKNLSIEFSFDYNDINRYLNILYKELGINLSDFKSLEDRVTLGKILAEKIQKNKEALSPEAKDAINKMVIAYRTSVQNVATAVSKMTESHTSDIQKGAPKYLNNSNSLNYLLFSNANGTGFKLRSSYQFENPLESYKVFEGDIDEGSTKELRITTAKPQIITGNTVVTNTANVTGVTSPKLSTDDTPGEAKPKIAKKKVFSIVSSLNKVRLASDEKTAAQIEDAMRMSGGNIAISQDDLNNEDVTGVVLGYFEKNLIRLNRNVKAAGVVYHEIFHGIFKMAVTPEQRRLYLDAVKDIIGKPKTTSDGRMYLRVKGKNVYFDIFRKDRRYSGVADDVIADYIYEEYLADGFRDYKLDKTEPKNKLIRFFYNMLDKLITLFKSKGYKEAKNKITGLYQDIDSGKYADAIYNTYEGPRAYELSFIPMSINEDRNVSLSQIDNNTNDQLIDRITREMLKRSGDIVKNNPDSFNIVYDDVTRELINYFKSSNFIESGHPNEAAVIAKYEPMFRAMRFMMGAAHRPGILENFLLENKSTDSSYDNFSFNDVEDSASFSMNAFEEIRNQVKKQYESIGIIKEEDTSENDDINRESSDDNETPDYIDSTDESSVGERYDDDGILTYKPYNGSKEFQKLIQYIKYEYEDSVLGIKFDKMVNSRDVINVIRKVTANIPKKNIIDALLSHIEYLNQNIEKFKKDNLENELGRIPNDMISIMNQHSTLKAVYETLDEQAGLDENLKCTRSIGESFFNMFHNVFYYAQKDITSVSIHTDWENVEKDVKDKLPRAPIRNWYTVQNLIQNNDINVVINNLRTAINLSLNNITTDEYKKLMDLLKVYSYAIPTTLEEFNNTVDYIYKLTSLGTLNIPRNVIEYSVAASVNKNLKNKSSFVRHIIAPNKTFIDKDQYMDMQKFMENYTSVFKNKEKASGIIDSSINTLIDEYKNSAPYQVKYEPGLTGTMVFNQDGKPISQFVPYVPSIQILNEIKNNGLKTTLDKYYRNMSDWFNDNTWLRSSLDDVSFDPNTKDLVTVLKDSTKIFMDAMDISIAGGLYQNFRGNRNQSTFKGLGEKGYMLSVLGMFSNRTLIKGNYGQDIVLFDRPITQLEATSTQFNITSLYFDYNQKGAKSTIANRFKGIIKQEFNRIKSEWDTRYDVKTRHESHNVNTLDNAELITDDPTLRAYNFNYLGDFFEYNDISKSIKSSLLDAAKNNLSFEEALNQDYYDVDNKQSEKTISQMLSQELLNYGETNVDDFIDYLISIDIGLDDLPSSVITNNSKNNLTKYDQVVDPIKKGAGSEYIFVRNEEGTSDVKNAFIRDFVYNYWFNSLYINQLFDGDISYSVKNFVEYFKRQKSGVAAGTNYSDIGIDEADDNTVVAIFKQFNGYLNEDPIVPMTTESNGTAEVPISDGQSWTPIDRRIKKYKASGILSPRLEYLLKKLRYTELPKSELEELRDNDLILSSDKPVVAHPLYYFKYSEHYINRADSSYVYNKERVAALYDQLDAIDFNDQTLDGDPLGRYQELIKEIHSNFIPKKGREFHHILLNSMEYHRVDVAFDDSVSKKATVSPLVISLDLLDKGITEGHPNMVQKTKDGVKSTPSVVAGYINLAYNALAIPNSLVYDQVKTGHISDTNTDAIQKKLLLPAQLDPKDFPEVKKIGDLQNEIANSRMQFLQRMFQVSDPASVVTKAIQAGLLKQGAGTNVLKYYALDENGKNEFNMNLPILGKTPLFYFFSIYNNNIFGPKVAGKKFYHVSNAGYKVVVDENDNVISRDELDANPEKYSGYSTRYPTVKEEYDKNGKLTRIIVEVIVPRELANTPEEREFFEALYREFLGARIPTEDKRSLLVAKVVDYIDASYGNSIIVPAQVHKWAGSDLDIDSLYVDVADYYRTVLGELVKYGDYDRYKESYGMTHAEAQFVEYLHFVANDPALSDLIDADIQKQAANLGYRNRSLKSIAGNFGPNIQAFWDDSENLVIGDFMQTSNTLTLMDRVISVINVLADNNLPSTKEQFYEFSLNEGNPVTPVLQNRILEYKKALLSNPEVYERFIKNGNADSFIEQYRSDKNITEEISDFKAINKSNGFTFQTIARVRALNNGAKDMLGANASQNKGASLIASAKIKLTKKYTFKFKYNNTKIETNTPLDNAVQLVGGAIGVSADDAKHQLLGPLRLSRINSAVMNALYIYGYPEQFGRLIHSVDAIAKSIKEFNIQSDPSYSRSGPYKTGFATFLRNKLAANIFNNIERLKAGGLLKDSEIKKGAYDIDHTKYSIEFTDIDSMKRVTNNAPSDFNIVVKDNKGTTLSNDLASIVLMSFYENMLQVGNSVAFKFSKLTDVYKQIKPSFDSLDKIRQALDFINDNDMFVNATDIFDNNPALKTLAQNVVNSMIDKSKQVLLDQTNLFRAITTIFKTDRSINQEQVVMELKSILGLSALNAYAKSKISDIDLENPTPEDTFLLALNEAMSPEYWINNTIENDLDYLREKFPDNEFLNSLSMKPAMYNGKGSVKVISSVIANKVTPETQDRLMNDFYQLIYNNDQVVYNMTIKLAVHGIIRDGAASRSGGYLKVLAPELFKYVSDRLNEVQTKLYSIDTTKRNKLETYIAGLDRVFRDVYHLPTTKSAPGVDSQRVMQSILTKLVSVLTKDSTSNPGIRMSFFQGNETYSPGKFSDISMNLFRQIVDSILPDNKAQIYVYDSSTGKTYPAKNLTLSAGIEQSSTKFEFWKGDNNGELLFKLDKIPAAFKAETDRMLKAQDIYPIKDGNYGFPLYQINSYEDGQLFMLTEIDGKPFNNEFFKNLFDSYKNLDDFEFLLRGKTAKYKIMNRQGVDRILPNAFTNQGATEIRAAVLGSKSVTSQRVKVIPNAPTAIKLMEGSSHLKTEDAEMAKQMKSKKYTLDNQNIKIGSEVIRYAVNAAVKNKVYREGKLMTEQQLDEFANKCGFSSFIEMNANPKMNEWLNPAKGVKTMWIAPYTVEKSAESNSVEITPATITTPTTQSSTTKPSTNGISNLTEEQIAFAKNKTIEQSFFHGKPYQKADGKWDVYKIKNGIKSSIEGALKGFRTQTTRSFTQQEALYKIAENQGLPKGSVKGTIVWMEDTGASPGAKTESPTKGQGGWFKITSEFYTPNKTDFNNFENWENNVWNDRSSEFKIGTDKEWKSIRFEKITQSSTSVKEGISELFDSNPELAQIGTPQEYSQYLDAIFPDSKVKDIVYRGAEKGIENHKAYSHWTLRPSLAKNFTKQGVNLNLKDETKNTVYFALLNIKNLVRSIEITDKGHKEKGFDAAASFPNQQKPDGTYYDNEEANEAIQLIDKNLNNEITVFEPEQIHILGNKQDIEGFKKFVTQPSTSVKVIPLNESQRFTRESAEKDTEHMYLFTDNAGRTSGSGVIDPNSWYAKKYGADKKYASKTQAVARGLENVYPITTMVDDKRTQWTDAQFDTYKKIIDNEIETIKQASKKYKGIKFSAEMPFGKGAISNMKDSAPKIWNYLNTKLAEIGIDNTDNMSKVIVTQSSTSVGGFQGYKGDFENTGKGTPEGDGKDKAMRKVADGFVVEVSKATPSSSLTSLKTGSIIEQIGPKEQTSARSTKNLADEGTTIMLARNGSLKDKPLSKNTKDMIKFYHTNLNMEFVVGDMPGVDSQFIDYLQEIGAKFTIYHTGTTPRIQVKATTQSSTSVKEGVPELFESNPELANAVYEILGLDTTEEISLDDAVGNTYVITTPMEVLPDEVQSDYRGLDIGDIFTIAWDGEQFGVYLIEEDFKVNTGLMIDEKGELKPFLDAQSLGYKKLQNPYLSNLSLRKLKGLLSLSDAKEELVPKSKVTAEQKQQAQQLYSQYLDTKQPDVILPIGTSGSGKSTFIKSLPQENLVIIEPDAMRIEFTGDMNDKSKDKEIYEEAANRAIQAIKQGKQVVFDTTNLTKDKRLPFIEAIKKAIPTANIQYKLMELNPELAKQRIKAQLERGENRAAVSDATIDRHAESYKQMLEDIKSEGITNYDTTQSSTSVEQEEEFNNTELNDTDDNPFCV